MTQANEHASPTPVDPPVAAGAAPPADGAAATPPPAPSDPDEIELQAANAAAEAEEAAATPPGTDPAATGGQPALKEPPKAAGQPAIPKARFDEVNGKLSEAERKIAYLQGQIDAGKPAAAPAPGQPQEPPVTPQQRLTNIRAEKVALASKFDAGEITMADYEVRRDALDDQVHAIREEATLGKVKPPEQKADTEDLYLDQQTAALEGEHPWVGIFDAVGSAADWAFLEARARENLAEAKIEVKGKIGTFHLREEMAKLADQHGPDLLTARASAKGIALPSQEPPPQQQQQPQPKPLSPQAQARSAKLDLAARAPPNLPGMTGSSPDPGVVSDAQIETGGDDGWEKLPAAQRQRILHGTA